MQTWAILENNIVVNRIVATQAFIDEHYPNAFQLTEDQPCDIGWLYQDGVFVEASTSNEDSLANLKLQALERLSEACSADITSGVSSNALGTEHFYGSDAKDQANLVCAIALDLEPVPYTCTEVVTGEKAMRSHTKAQLKTLLLEAAFRRIGLQQKYEGLRVAIEQAETVEAIEAVRW